jgi:hypothetical protein
LGDLRDCALPEYVKVAGGLLPADPCYLKVNLRNIFDRGMRVSAAVCMVGC